MAQGLFILVEREKILLDYNELPWNILGVYYHIKPDPPVILLHNVLKNESKLLRCVLAEELGHHYTTTHNLLAFARSDKVSARKYERQALYWAAKYLMPYKQVQDLLAKFPFFGCFELAEYFNVTERFAGTAIKIYKEKQPELQNEEVILSKNLITLEQFTS